MLSFLYHNIAPQSKGTLGKVTRGASQSIGGTSTLSLASILRSRARNSDGSVSAPTYVKYFLLQLLITMAHDLMILFFKVHLVEERRSHSI